MHYPPRGAGQVFHYLSWRWVAAALRLTIRRVVLCIKAARQRRGGAVLGGKNGTTSAGEGTSKSRCTSRKRQRIIISESRE